MRENSILKDRILKYLENKGVSKYEFYQKTGISNGILSQKNGLSEENVLKFLSYYKDINPSWLLTGNGSMLLDDNKSVVSEPVTVYNSSRIHPDTQNIPLYDVEAAAGIVSLFNDTHNNPIDHIRIPGIPKCDGAIPISGDSMYPLLKSGDIVLYKQVTDPLNAIYFFGEMYIIGIEQDGDDYVVVKYIHKSDKGDEYIKLVSQNQHHDSFDIPKKSIRALAIVRASIRINSMK